MFDVTRKTLGFIFAMALFLFVLTFLMVGMAAKADAGNKQHAGSGGGSVNVWEDTYCRNPHHGGCGPIARVSVKHSGGGTNSIWSRCGTDRKGCQ